MEVYSAYRLPFYYAEAAKTSKASETARRGTWPGTGG